MFDLLSVLGDVHLANGALTGLFQPRVDTLVGN